MSQVLWSEVRQPPGKTRDTMMNATDNDGFAAPVIQSETRQKWIFLVVDKRNLRVLTLFLPVSYNLSFRGCTDQDFAASC
jgi:hypothetical protein